MPGLSGLVLDPKKNTTPGAGLGSMAGSPSTLASPTSSMGGINKPTQPSPPMGGGLNATIGNNYNDLLGGKNQALDQATRTTLNALGGQRKGAASDAAQKAARMGLAPGSPGYNQIMSQAESAVTSSGSNLLSGLAQKGFDQQTANLTGAQMFQSGMDKTANEVRALDQGDARVGLEGLRVGNETDLAGNTIRKTNSDINIDQGQLGVTKDLAGNTIRKTTADIGIDAGQLGVTRDLAGNTIRKTDADILSGQRNDNLNFLLGSNTIKKTDADIANNAGHLDNENALTGNTVNKTNADILNDKGQLDLNNLLGANTIKKTDADIANDKTVTDNQGRVITGNETKTKIDALDSIIGHPESYSAAQIAQAKAARAKLAPDGAGTGGAADPTDQEAAVNYLADSLAQHPEYAGMPRDQLLEMARKQFGALDTNNMNSLLGSGLGNIPGSTGKKDPETGVVLTGNPIIDGPKIEAAKGAKANAEAEVTAAGLTVDPGGRMGPYPGETAQEYKARMAQEQTDYDNSHQY